MSSTHTPVRTPPATAVEQASSPSPAEPGVARVQAPDSTSHFPDLAPLERWGGSIAEVVIATVGAAAEVLTAFTRRQMSLRAAVAAGVAPPRSGALSAYREGLLGQISSLRFRENARRLAALVHIVRLCAPTKVKVSAAMSSFRSMSRAVDGDKTSATASERDPELIHLWPLVARHVKHDLAVVAGHLQLEIAVLHAVILPPRDREAITADPRAVARNGGGTSSTVSNRVPLLVADESTLNDEDAALVTLCSEALSLHASQYLSLCQDALELASSVVDQRIHLEQTRGGASTAAAANTRALTEDEFTVLPAGTPALQLPTTPASLADGSATVRIDDHPDASLSEDNTLYLRLLERHRNPALEQLGAAVTRVETLSQSQVEIINGPLRTSLWGRFICTTCSWRRSTTTNARLVSITACTVRCKR
jgi:hypothetical protein